MIHDNCLIIENIVSDVKLTQDKGNVYSFEGTFTVFDIQNENGRYYRKNNFMPLVESLQPLIEKKKLMGELDHPKDFSIKLDRASHVIEKLELDESGTKIVGKIRLLDTDKGKNAKAIADAGVPLHISSRASGRVLENGDVEINRLYTYDLVADPGFKEAELRGLNESISNEEISEMRLLVESLNSLQNDENKLTLIKEDKGLKIYSIEPIKETIITPNPQIQKIEETTDMSEFVKVEAMQKWSTDVIQVIAKMTEKIELLEGKTANTTIQEKKYELVSEEDKYQITCEGKVVFEDADEDVTYDKLDELNGNNFYSEIKRLKDQFNTRFGLHNEYLEYLKENIENVGTYAEEHLKESIQGIANYCENYLREQLENIGNYSEVYLKENIEQIADYASNHLRTNIENIGNYAEIHLKESIEQLAEGKNNRSDLAKELDDAKEELSTALKVSNKMSKEDSDKHAAKINDLNAKIKGLKEKLSKVEENKKEFEINNEVIQISNLTDYKDELQNKIKAIQEEAKKQNANSNNPAATAINENIEEPKEQAKPLFIFMPQDIKVKWDKLSEGRKEEILEVSNNYTIESQGQVETFWYQYVVLEDRLNLNNDKKVVVTEQKTGHVNDLTDYGIDVSSLINAVKGIK